MLLVKKVREFAKMTAWAMHKRMGRNSLQSYLALERQAKKISLSDLLTVKDIYIEHGGTEDGFDKLLKQCAVGKK